MPTLADVAAAIVQVRPDLDGTPIDGHTRVVSDLAMDSLDLLQLGRALRKQYGVQLDLESWPYRTTELSAIFDHLAPVG